MMRPMTDLDSIERETTITFFRRGGPGGQHRNKTETGVRLLHRPTGVTAAASELRSQSRNRAVAFARLQRALIARQTRPKRRVSTRVPPRSRTRRLDDKKQQSRKKVLRQKIQ
jgi:protein subunit release factor B